MKQVKALTRQKKEIRFLYTDTENKYDTDVQCVKNFHLILERKEEI